MGAEIAGLQRRRRWCRQRWREGAAQARATRIFGVRNQCTGDTNVTRAAVAAAAAVVMVVAVLMVVVVVERGGGGGGGKYGRR